MSHMGGPFFLKVVQSFDWRSVGIWKVALVLFPWRATFFALFSALGGCHLQHGGWQTGHKMASHTVYLGVSACMCMHGIGSGDQ